MSADRVRVFEKTYVPTTFEKFLVPFGEDPDGLGPLSYEDRRLRMEFGKACNGSKPALKRLAKELYKHQKYQLINSHAIVDGEGEAADNMDIEDICPWLAKLDIVKLYNPTYVYDENEPDCRYEFSEWVFEVCADEGIWIEMIAAVRAWHDEGAFELTPYPGDRAIDGDGNYPIFVPPDPSAHLLREIELLRLQHPEFADAGEPPKRTQSRTFIECQYKQGQSGNNKGRPRRPREIEDIDERRPHFFDTTMPLDGAGDRVAYGERIADMARSRAAKDEDWAWLSQMNSWARSLDRLRTRRKKLPNSCFVYEETLDVTRIDIAIRHLGLVDVQWRKSPSARWVINPWGVSAALERKKKDSLTREDMEGIYLRTKTPHHVDWPKWWPEDLRCKQSKNEQLARPRRRISGMISKT